jgi:type I restriction enzyme S subunit
MNHPQVPLGEVADFVNGAAFKPEDWGVDGLPIIRIQNLTDLAKPFNYTERIVPEKLVVNPGDLLVSWSATLGVFQWNGPKGLLNQHIFRVLPNDEVVDKNYLKHTLGQAINDMERHLHGATMKHVNRAEFLGTRIPLPPLEEQRRIAAILDKVALLIQSAAHAFFLSQELKKSLVHETLGLAREGDERVRIKVSEVADMITGFPFKSAQYTDKAQHTRLCRGINVLPDRIEWKQVARWPEITPELRSYQIDEDDILIAMDRPWITEGFKIARVKPIDIPSLLVQRVARIRAGNQILPRILFEVLSSKAFATHCTPTETTVPHISPIEIREYEFELPCLKEQKRIDSILAGIEKSQAAMNQRANLLKEKLCTLSRSYFN